MEEKIKKVFQRYDPKEILSYLILTFNRENNGIDYDRILPSMIKKAYEILTSIPEYSLKELNIEEIEWSINTLRKLEIETQMRITDFYEKITSENYFIEGDSYIEFTKEDNIKLFSKYDSWFKKEFSFTIEEVYSFLKIIENHIIKTNKKVEYEKVSDFIILNKKDIVLNSKNSVGFSKFIDLLRTNFQYCNLKENILLKPFVFFDEDNFLPIYGSIFDKLRYIFEGILKKYNNDKNYGDNKGDFLEEQLYRKITEKFNSVKVLKNPHHRYTIGEFEELCDVLIVYDNNLILFEAKAKRFNLKIKKISKNKIIDNIKDILVMSYQQLEKSEKIIKNNDRLILYDKKTKNEVLNINLEKYSNIFLVNITLDNLGTIGTIAKILGNINYKIKKNFFSFNLSDLKIILEHIEFPSQFVHYLMSLNKIYENKVVPYASEDAIDFFGHYQKTNFKDMIEETIRLPNYRDSEFNLYYLHKYCGKKSTKIHQKLSKKQKTIIKDLEYNVRMFGKSDIIFKILNLNFMEREKRIILVYLLIISKKFIIFISRKNSFKLENFFISKIKSILEIEDLK